MTTPPFKCHPAGCYRDLFRVSGKTLRLGVAALTCGRFGPPPCSNRFHKISKQTLDFTEPYVLVTSG